MEASVHKAPSLIDFLIKPSKIQGYNEKDIVTRDNFMGMIIKSLSFGGGSIDRQQLYFIWLEKNGKFDNYSSQFSDFFRKGGWNILSDDEKEKFSEVFASIAAHHVKNLVSKPATEFKLDPAGTFESNIPYKDSDTNLMLKIDLSNINLVGISKSNLSLLAKKYQL